MFIIMKSHKEMSKFSSIRQFDLRRSDLQSYIPLVDVLY